MATDIGIVAAQGVRTIINNRPDGEEQTQPASAELKATAEALGLGFVELPITPGMGEAGDDTRFAAAIAGFGQLLQGGTYLGDWSYADAIRLATGAKGDDPYGYRAEAVTLMRLAESLDK